MTVLDAAELNSWRAKLSKISATLASFETATNAGWVELVARANVLTTQYLNLEPEIQRSLDGQLVEPTGSKSGVDADKRVGSDYAHLACLDAHRVPPVASETASILATATRNRCKSIESLQHYDAVELDLLVSRYRHMAATHDKTFRDLLELLGQ